MDAGKTGAFIAQLRKEKGYTQKELAEKLNVSDKAISRWETGKGFPETTLLKPLSDELGVSISELLAGERIPEETIKEKADHVIVTSMEDSKKKLNSVKTLCIGLAVLLVICLLFTFLPVLTEPSAIEFVNASTTYMRYPLAHSGNDLCYGDLIHKELQNGYEYYLQDGTQRYVFTNIADASEPVLSYMHHSGGDGMIFGFRIGDNTVIKENEDLGIESNSLHNFLIDSGFHLAYDDLGFGRPTLIYVDGERCNWYTYSKENVFINICISAHKGNRLMGYDIGLIDSSLDVFFEEMLSGFPILLEDPYHLVTSEIEAAYPQWEPITITVSEGLAVEALYLYINGELIDKFTDSITFKMWGAPISVLITPEVPHEHAGEFIRSEETHRMEYTCGCPSPNNAEPHTDTDSDNACDVCGYPISSGNCPFEWIRSGTGHYKQALCDCCAYPTVEYHHVNYDEDMCCDICEYDLGQTEPANHFLRDQAGAAWLHEIAAEEIAQIEIIRKAVGAAPGTLKSIARSCDKQTIAQTFADYWQMTVTPVTAQEKPSDTIALVTVTFTLNDGTEYKLSVAGGYFYDTNGHIWKLRYIPTFREGTVYTKCFGFIASQETAEIWYLDPYSAAYPDYSVCQIPIDEIEFIVVDSYVPPEGGFEGYSIKTEFGDLGFESWDIFHIPGDYTHGRPTIYKLIGLNLYELIDRYRSDP